jgi:hypothetical protein
MHRAS